eukprot:SM000030S11340  [mRNA]  locus=s30:276134:277109:+ [translate_table: standard]
MAPLSAAAAGAWATASLRPLAGQAFEKPPKDFRRRRGCGLEPWRGFRGRPHDDLARAHLAVAELGIESTKAPPLLPTRRPQGHASEAAERVGCDCVVAIEGGLERLRVPLADDAAAAGEQVLCCAWAIVLSECSEGGGVAEASVVMLPPLLQALQEGREEVVACEDGHAGGAAGQHMQLEHAVGLALIPFVSTAIHRSPSVPELPRTTVDIADLRSGQLCSSVTFRAAAC